MKRHRGFTLIEVLAAMAVLALTLGAILSAAAHYGRNAIHLQERMVAGWVAHNLLVEARLEREWPSLGTRTGRVEMARRTWFWEREVQETPDEDIRRVTVRIRQDGGDEDRWIGVLKGFFARPDAPVPP